MKDDAERILNYHRQIESLQRRRDKAAGAEEQLRRQAKKELGASTDADLKALQAKEVKLADRKEAEWKAKEAEFLKEYGKLLEEGND